MKMETFFKVVGIAIPIVGALGPLVVKSLSANERWNPVLINVIGRPAMAKKARLGWRWSETLAVLFIAFIAAGAFNWLAPNLGGTIIPGEKASMLSVSFMSYGPFL